MAFLSLVRADSCWASANPIEIKFLGVSIKTIAERILNFLLSLVGSIAFLFLIGSGIYYIISNGNPEAQKKAKRMLLSALEGLLVVSFSYILVAFVDRFLVK